MCAITRVRCTEACEQKHGDRIAREHTCLFCVHGRPGGRFPQRGAPGGLLPATKLHL